MYTFRLKANGCESKFIAIHLLKMSTDCFTIQLFFILNLLSACFKAKLRVMALNMHSRSFKRWSKFGLCNVEGHTSKITFWCYCWYFDKIVAHLHRQTLNLVYLIAWAKYEVKLFFIAIQTYDKNCENH